MNRSQILAPMLAASALCLSFATPAHAGKADRAREAIAAAQAKIDTAESLGTATAQPGETARAKAQLARAKEDLSAGRKNESIDEAIQASALADTAIGVMQKHKEEAAHAQAEVHADQVMSAQQQAEAAKAQADAANARASVAENAAASSAADAAVARNAAVAAQATAPAQVETTVTTQQATTAAAPRKVTVRKTVRHHTHVRAKPAASVTTTTTKITQPAG